jgi:PAS domain S-box-containing protein
MPRHKTSASQNTSVELPHPSVQKQVEEPLHEAREPLPLIMDGAKDYAIFALDLEGRVMTWSTGAEQVFGYKQSEIVGATVSLLYTPEEQAARIPEGELRRAAELGVAEIERWHVRKDGSRFFASGMVRPVHDETGALCSYVIVAHDTTEHKLEEDRTRLLQQLTAELSAGSTLQELSTTIIRAVQRAMGEAMTSVFLLSPDGQTIERVSSEGLPGSFQQQFPRLYLSDPFPVTDAVRNSAVVSIGSQDDYIRRYPALQDQLIQLGLHANISLPLILDGKVMGCLSILFYQQRWLSAREHDLLVSIASLCAQALQRAQLFEAEQQARHAAARLAERITRLQAVTGQLTRLLSVEQVARLIVDEALVAMGAVNGRLNLVDANHMFTAAYSTGLSVPEAEQIPWLRYPVDPQRPLGDAALRGEPIWLENKEAVVENYPDMARFMDLYPGAWVALPLMIEQRVIGVLGFAFNQAHHFDEEERRFMLALAQQCAQSVERARLFEAEQAARQEATRRSERLARLQNVTVRLSQLLTFDQVARLMVDEVVMALDASTGAFHLLEDAHTFLAVYSVGSKMNPSEQSQWRRFPANPQLLGGDAVRRGELIWIESSQDLLKRYPVMARIAEIYPGAWITLPLFIDGHIIGIITIAFEEERPFDEEVRNFILALAQQCAQALERARLYDAEQQAAQRIARLQEITALFSEALTPVEIAEIVIEKGILLLQAHAGVVATLDETRREAVLLNPRRLPGQIGKQFERIPLDTRLPLTDALRNGEPIWITSRDQFLADYPHMQALLEQTPSQATAALPLMVNGRIIGGLGLSFLTPNPFVSQDRELLFALARQCAGALERARLYIEEQRARQLLEERVRLQSMITELGQEAVARFNMSDLMEKTVTMLARGLNVEYVRVMEFLPEEDCLLVKAGVGWREGVIGLAKVSAGKETQAGYSLLSGQPVIIDDLSTETRFSSPLLADYPIVSGINVVIPGHAQPWGILSLHSSQQRVFTSDDLYFVQSVANILAAALERARLDIMLEAEHQRLANILATVPGIIWENQHLDEQTEMKLVFISGYVETMLGYTVEEALAEPHFWFKIFHPDDAEKTADAFYKVRRSRGSGVVNFRAVHKNGEILFIQALMTTILQDGKPTGKRGVMMDVSERQQLMDAQSHYMALLQRSNEELRQFAYVASHDLQEPLRMVASYLQLLEMRYADQLDETAHEFIAYAVNGAVRMKELLTALLDYSRVDREEKSFESFDSGTALNTALANLSLQIEESSVQITHDELPVIRGDRSQITRIFQNLISNGIKFQPEGNTPKIHIGVERQEQGWEFSVRDNGIGIDPTFLDRIFIIFKRLHTQAQYPGTGIGLAICKKIVERHGGRIWANSRLGLGTSIYFIIPF